MSYSVIISGKMIEAIECFIAGALAEGEVEQQQLYALGKELLLETKALAEQEQQQMKEIFMQKLLGNKQ